MYINKETIIKSLKIIGQRLLEKGLKGEILIAGGAAMCLAHDARDSTEDLDAIFKPFNEIYSISLDLVDELNLPIGWLNDAIKVFMTKDPPKNNLFNFPGLDVFTVSPEYLLIMKLASFRSGTSDFDDAKLLIKMLEIDSLYKAKELLRPYLPLNDKFNIIIDHLTEILEDISDKN
jgi:hypothetical protein